jgi:sigma-E factor negative regulatory protein RseA
MNDAIKAQISAFVDGELPENEAEMLLRRMSQDRELRQQAAEYLAMGRAVRGERTFAGMDTLRERISDAIDDTSIQQDLEPEVSASPRYLRPMAGIAIAATVALAVIFGLQQMTGNLDGDAGQAGDTVADADNRGYVVPDHADDQLREYYLRHAASSSYVGASSINARLVTLELADGVLIETEEEPESGDDAAPETP